MAIEYFIGFCILLFVGLGSLKLWIDVVKESMEEELRSSKQWLQDSH